MDEKLWAFMQIFMLVIDNNYAEENISHAELTDLYNPRLVNNGIVNFILNG